MNAFAKLCFLLVSPICLGQTPGPATPQPSPGPVPQDSGHLNKNASWTDHYRKSTVSFGITKEVDGVQTYVVLGTGVIIATDAHHGFFVTAKHVFYEAHKNWYPNELQVRFAVEEKRSLTEDLGITLTLRDKEGKNLWSFVDDDVDIAAIAVPDAFKPVISDAIGFQDFATDDDVYDGASIFVFGYPDATQPLVGKNALVRAITRAGVIAWTDPAGVLENPLLLDSNLLPGNSGGPAFKVPTGISKSGGFQVGGRVAFIGIVTAGPVNSVPVQAGGRSVGAEVDVVGIGGLGKVEPAMKIKKLIESMAQKQ